MEDIEHEPSSVDNVIVDNDNPQNEDTADPTKVKVLENITLEFYLDTFAEDEIPCIYLPPFLKSPSECRGMTQEEEHKFRIFGCELIQESGILLKVPQGTTCMAQFIFHRFYYKRSFLEADVRTFSSACLFLATKIEETSRKLRDIVSVVDYALKLKAKAKPTEVLDLSSQLYLNMRQDVVDAERLILKELGFQVYRLDMSHPHKYILNYIRMLKGNKYLAQKAWNYINDSYRSPLCVFYRPNVVAAAAIYLAARTLDFPLPELEWWLVFDAPWTEIEEICAEILFLYEQPKIELNFIVGTIDKYEPKAKAVEEPVITEHEMLEKEEKVESNGHIEPPEGKLMPLILRDGKGREKK